MESWPSAAAALREESAAAVAGVDLSGWRMRLAGLPGSEPEPAGAGRQGEVGPEGFGRQPPSCWPQPSGSCPSSALIK